VSADEWLLLVEGSRYAWGTGGVFSVSSYSDGAAPLGIAIKRGYLQPVRSVISERLRPLDGNVEVSALDFIVHDTDGSGTDQFTRTLDESALTFLTAPVLVGDTSITVANGGAIASFPTFVWINRECMRVFARAGNVLQVDRGYFGTKAEAIEVDAAQALQPELFAYPCTLRGRRARLYRVNGIAATLRWLGYVRSGPVVAANGASFVLQCAHAWEQEAASVWGNPRPSATLTGYDSAAIAIVVENDNRSAVAYSAPPTYKAYVHQSRQAAVNAALARLATQLTSLGATNVFYAATDTGGELLVSLRFATFTLGRATLRYGGEEVVATSSDNSGTREHVWRVSVPDRGALVRTGFALGGDDRATVIRPHVGLTTTSWAAIAGSRAGVSITPVLVGELGDDALLELDPTGQSTPGVVTNDATFTQLGATVSSGATTFRAFSRVIQRDPTARPQPIAWDAHRAGLPIAEALPLYSAVRIDAEHWLDACRSLLEDDSYATSGSDSRNWSWTGYDSARAASRDDLGPVTYRTSGNVTVGEHVAGEARLRGCCVTVGSDARLGIIDLRSPTLTETPAATITVRDWVAGSVQSVAPSGDGLVTDVAFETPLRTMTLRDAVALGRYGTQSLLKVSTQSTRQDPRIVDDPIGYSLLALGKILGRWRDELFIYTGSVPADRFLSSCTLGAIVAFESSNAPNFRGTSKFSGANAKRAVIIGRHEDPATNTLELELLALPIVYGFAPAARVESISGAVIQLAGAYAGTISDYSGSSETGYDGVADDRGAGWFAAGYVCELVLRDTATHTAQTFTVASNSTGSATVTATAAIPTSPTNWAAIIAGGAIVDVVFTSLGSTVTAQRLFAVVADETTRTVAGSGPPRKWAP